MARGSILITGGLGFVGQAIMQRLTNEGCGVRVLDNLSNSCVSADQAKLAGAEVKIGDVCNLQDCIEATEGINSVIHLAAQTGVLPSVKEPAKDLEINGFGTLNMLMACRQKNIETFVLASSNAVIGLADPPVHEEMMPVPQSPYGASKLLAESYCRTFSYLYGMRTHALRFSNIYGPGSVKKGSVVAKFMKDAIVNNTLTIFGNGNQTRDFLYIEDLIDAILTSLDLQDGGGVFCLGSGCPTTIETLAQIIQELYCSWSGKPLLIKYESPRRGEIEKNFSSITKARVTLKFRPKKHLKAGLKETWQWFTENSKAIT